MERVKEEVRKKIIENVNRLIGQDGVTCFARSIGVSRDTVNNWISGKSDIRLNDLVKIREKYGVNIDFLLGLSDNPAISADVQIACKTTGLSEKAIENARRDDTKALSLLLEDKKLLELLEDVADLYHRTGALIAKIEEINATGITADGIDDLDYMYRCVRLEKNDIQNAFGAIVERLVPTNDTLSTAKAILREYGRA